MIFFNRFQKKNIVIFFHIIAKFICFLADLIKNSIFSIDCGQLPWYALFWRITKMKNVFYETGHGIGAELFTVEQNEDFSYPLHLHRCFEIIYLLDGEMDVTVENRVYRLSKDESIIIKPHEIHGLETKEKSRHILCIFSPELIGGAGDILIEKQLITPIIKAADDFYRRMFLSLNNDTSIYGIKGFLYCMCDVFIKNLTDKTDTKNKNKDIKLLHDVLSFIEENYASSCSLSDVAASVNYSYSYISKLFSESIGIPYYSYVTQLRIGKVCSILKNENCTVLEAALKSGFTSLRSFNRNFYDYTGKTPSEYRSFVTNKNA